MSAMATETKAQTEPARAMEGKRLALDALERLTLEELREVMKQAGELIAAKEREGQAAALAEIQRIAKEHGLSVDVKSPRKRRGRPPKAKTAGAQG